MLRTRFYSNRGLMGTVLALLGVILFSTPAFAQEGYSSQDISYTIISRSDNQGNRFLERYSENEIVTQIVTKDSLVATLTLDLSEQLDVIVQFGTDPIVLRQQKELDIAVVQADHDRFTSDLQRIENDIRIRSEGRYPKVKTEIRRKFLYAFNGVALSGTRRVIQEIKKLPYVLKVHKDVQVKADLTESVPLINADDVWNNLGATGNGVLVGVIDTGIDYNHPDLGGGFGAGFKVSGGYDFVNNDSDPMDDHGHGTHVAGIIAANGVSLKGVAPDAALLAYKVLDANGRGSSSDVIAAIERSLDPDQNPATDDAVDVINLSLSGPGDPDDAASQTVDNAVAAGVVCVASADNRYNYLTIGSPGTARKAITVGATDKSDIIASFSSRGPSPKIYAIKPDIVAPGVDINSTWLDNDYNSISGTSMAAPHVAGTAALLHQLYPIWTPEMVKAALMESSIDIGEDAFTQGSGRIDAYGAATIGSIIIPGSVSLGVDDISQNTWAKSETLQVRNVSGIQQTYTMSISESFPAGIVTSISPTSFTLNPTETQLLVFDISVDNSIVPFPPDEPYSYEGKIITQSGTETLAVPFAFIKSSRLEITFDKEPWTVLIHNRIDNSWSYAYPGTYLSVLLPQGTYDIITTFADYNLYRVVKEDILVEQVSALNINKTEADNEIDIHTFDENGTEIYGRSGQRSLIHRNSGIGQLTTGGFSIPPYFSNVSQNYKFDWRMNMIRDGKYYQFSGTKFSVTEDTTFTNSPSDLNRFTIFIHAAPLTTELYFKSWAYHFTDGGWYIMARGNSNNYDMSTTLASPFAMDYYYIIPQDSLYYNLTRINILEEEDGATLYETLYLRLEGDGIAGLFFDFGFPQGFYSTSDKLDISLSPPCWSGRFYNLSDQIRLDHYTSRYNRNYYYSYQMKDHTLDYVHYTLYRNGEIVGQDSLLIGNGSYYDKIDVPPGVYSFELPYEYYVQDRPSNSMVHASFDTQNSDNNPPYITSFNVLSNGEVTDILDPSMGTNEIRFAMEDDINLKQVALYCQVESSPTWNQLPLNNVGSLYSTQIPQTIGGGFISLKIVADDYAGNNLTYEMNPAFKSTAPAVTQTIPITHGKLNTISFNILPPDLAVDIILDDLETLLVAQDDDGKFYIPPYSVNTIGDVDLTNGYQVYIMGIENDTVENAGYPLVPQDYSQALNNTKLFMIGYPYQNPHPVEDVFNSIVSSVVVVQDDEGRFWIPMYGVNTMGDMQPGKGYQIYVNQTVNFTYPYLPGGLAKEAKPIAKISEPSHFKFQRTGLPYGIVLTGSEEVLTIGDEVGVFAGELCVGASVFTGDYPLVIEAWEGHEKYGLTGFKAGETISFRVWKASEAQEVEVVGRFATLTESTFRGGPISVVRLGVFVPSVAIPNAFGLDQNYPNPFNPETVIAYQLPEDSKISLRIYNLLGQKIRSLVDEPKKAGYHRVSWDGKDALGEEVSSGMYLYTIEASDFRMTRKMVRMR